MKNFESSEKRGMDMVPQFKRKRFLSIIFLLLMAIVGSVEGAYALPAATLDALGPDASDTNYFTNWSIGGLSSVETSFIYDELYYDGFSSVPASSTTTITHPDGSGTSSFLLLDDPLAVAFDSTDYARDPSLYPTAPPVSPADTSAYFGSYQTPDPDFPSAPITTDFGGWDSYFGDTWATTGTILSATLELKDTQTLNFRSNFLPFDFATGLTINNDYALVVIEGSGVNEPLFTAFDHMIGGLQFSYHLISDVETRTNAHLFDTPPDPSYSSGWDLFTWNPATDYLGTIKWVVGNGDALYNPSAWAITGLTAGSTASVPEPGTLALMSIGLVGMGLLRRREK